MIPASFDYARPKTLSEAVTLLGQNPEAKILAGGHSLIPMMRFRMADAAHAHRYQPSSKTCPTSKKTAIGFASVP